MVWHWISHSVEIVGGQTFINTTKGGIENAIFCTDWPFTMCRDAPGPPRRFEPPDRLLA
jgi:hypothetical protein